MRTLWWATTTSALVCVALAGCASPRYPVQEGQAAGSSSVTMPKPKYPVSEDASSQAQPAAAQSAQSARPAPATDAAPAEPALPSTAAPVAPVQSETLPPLSSASAPPAAVTPASTASQPAAAPAATPPPPASAAPADAPLVPRALVHDQVGAPAQPSTAPVAASVPSARQAPVEAADPPRRTVPTRTITGDVVAASGIFEDYEVQKGDHVDALARAFSTTRHILLDANDLKPPYRLHPGQIIKVPVAKAYVAERGDTLSGVGRRFGVEPGELAEINHISSRSALRPGQRIGLPSSMRDRGPLRSSTSSEEYVAAPPPPRPRYVATPPPPTSSYQAPSYQTAAAAPSAGLTPMAPTSPPTPVHMSPPTAAYQAPPPSSAAPQATTRLTDAQIVQATHGRFVWPVRGEIISSFGPKGQGQRNDGVDIKVGQSTSVRAAAAGQVVYAGDQVKGDFGNLVLVEHAGGWFTAYAHLGSITVHMMDQVTQGQEIGQLGTNLGVPQPVLHFEIRYHSAPGEKTQPIDPILVLPSG